MEPADLRAGQRHTLKLHVSEETSERPLCGANVVIKLVNKNGATTELLSAMTDASGTVEAVCEIPAQPGTSATVVCEAEAVGKTAEVRYRVKRRAPGSVSHA